MSGMGFPSRFTRSALGPKLKNTHPVEDPETQIGVESFNPLFWQAAGQNLVSWRALLVATWTGSAFTAARYESWNANGDQSHPTLTRNGVGDYSYQFAATYKDEEDSDTNVGLTIARAGFFGAVAAAADVRKVHAWRDTTDPTLIRIKAWDSSNAPVDCSFWLEVF